MRASTIYAQVVLLGAALALLSGALEVAGHEFLGAFLTNPSPPSEVFRNYSLQIYTMLIPAVILLVIVLIWMVRQHYTNEKRIDWLERRISKLEGKN